MGGPQEDDESLGTPDHALGGAAACAGVSSPLRHRPDGSPVGVKVPVSNATRAYILARLERLHTLLNQLDRAAIVAGKPVRTRMRRELTAAKKAVRRLLTDRAK